MTQPQHIILGGPARAGKSTSAMALPCHTRLAFADALKDLVAELYDLTREQLEARKDDPWPITIGGRELTIIADHVGRRVPIEKLFQITFKTPRALLQTLGTDVIRKIDPDWHVRKLLARMEPDVAYKIDDCRFENELHAIPGAVTIYVTNPNVTPDAHESENSLSAADFSATVVNDGTVEELMEKVLQLCL